MNFIDKNVLFDYVKLIYFSESYKYYRNQAMIVMLINEGKFNGFISDATPFSVANYLSFKLERNGIQETDLKVRNAMKSLFKEKQWETVSLSINEFRKALEEKRLPLEDAYQYECAKKKCKTIITSDLKDFQVLKKEFSIITPKEFIETHYAKEKEEYYKRIEELIQK